MPTLRSTGANIEMCKGRGGQMVRTAGGYAILMAKDGDYVSLKLPSGEVRRILTGLGRHPPARTVRPKRDRKQ